MSVAEDQRKINKFKSEQARQKRFRENSKTKPVVNDSNSTFIIQANIRNTDIKYLVWEFSPEDTVTKIKECLIATELPLIKPENLIIRGGENNLPCSDEKTLEQCGISKFQTILITQRLDGGMMGLFQKKFRLLLGFEEQVPQRLPNWDCSEIEATIEQDCIIPQDEEQLNVKMPCGHVFSSHTLFCIIDSNAKQPLCSWKCPIIDCNRDWKFDTLSAAADLTEEEHSKYFVVYNLHKAKLNGGIKDCPFCKVCCERPTFLGQLRVRCTNCNNNDFCWCCEKKWIGSGITICGNKNCPTYTINSILSECEIIESSNLLGLEGQISVPSLRACPRCVALVEHTTNCKHHKCYECNTDFCFVCLQVKEKGNDVWPCGSYSFKCVLAPKQKF